MEQEQLYGFMPGLTVGTVLARVLLTCPGIDLVAVRSIDSGIAADSICRALDFHHAAFEIIGDTVCLPTADLRSPARNQELFTGFDELWFLARRPPTLCLAGLPHLTSDAADFSAGVPAEIIAEATANGTVLVIADGCGLNYLTTYPELLRAIKGSGKEG